MFSERFYYGQVSQPVNLFQSGAWTLHSGANTTWKIDCDALTEWDICTLAQMILEQCPLIGAVEGVPRGGVRLAAAIERLIWKPPSGQLLIVDDVLTTGASLEAHRNGRDALGAVIFARGPVPSWVTPLFQYCPRSEKS